MSFARIQKWRIKFFLNFLMGILGRCIWWVSLTGNRCRFGSLFMIHHVSYRPNRKWWSKMPSITSQKFPPNTASKNAHQICQEKLDPWFLNAWEWHKLNVSQHFSIRYLSSVWSKNEGLGFFETFLDHSWALYLMGNSVW